MEETLNSFGFWSPNIWASRILSTPKLLKWSAISSEVKPKLYQKTRNKQLQNWTNYRSEWLCFRIRVWKSGQWCRRRRRRLFSWGGSERQSDLSARTCAKKRQEKKQRIACEFEFGTYGSEKPENGQRTAFFTEIDKDLFKKSVFKLCTVEKEEKFICWRRKIRVPFVDRNYYQRGPFSKVLETVK